MVSLRSVVDAIPVGQRTVGTADDVSLIYRYVPSPTGGFGVVPDSERATQLAGSPAGGRLERALTRFAAQEDNRPGRSDLASVTIVPDADALAGFELLRTIERSGAGDFIPAADADRMRSELARLAAAIRADIKAGAHGAFNGAGHIYVMPEHSHALLASVGAYAVAPRELIRRTPQQWREFMSSLMRHETEHSITPGTGNPESWEEGIAEVLSDARPVLRAAQHDLPPPASGWGVQDPASPAVTADWKPVQSAPSKARSEWNAVYERRERALVGLLELAGVDRDTDAGYIEARSLLQGGPVEQVPTAVAAKLVERHGADTEIVSRLSAAIEDLERPRLLEEVAGLLGVAAVPSS